MIKSDDWEKESVFSNSWNEKSESGLSLAKCKRRRLLLHFSCFCPIIGSHVIHDTIDSSGCTTNVQ